MKNVINYIQNLNIDKPVVLACSYGPDSMCLLDILINCNINVIVAHVNHNLREESKQEYTDLYNYCKDNNIIFEGYTIDNFPKGNIEKEARDIRYNFFETILKKYNTNYLFTAHHGDDLTETIIMRISRGASFKAYAGFEVNSKIKDYNLIRPLIYTNKESILSYCTNNKIPYAIDKTNLENIHTRNKIRNKILPVLKDINPDFHNKFIKFSNNIIDYYNYVNEEVNSYKKILYDKNKYLDKNDIIMLPEFIQKLLLMNILSDIYLNDIDLIEDKHIKLIINLINSDKQNSMINLPKDIIAYKFYNIIDIRKKEEIFDYNYEIDKEICINNNFIALVNKSDKIKSNYVIRLSLEDIKMPLRVRNRKVGDKILLKNGTKSIGDILSEAKINKIERDIYPIVVDSTDKILWIPGIKKSKFDRQNDKECDIIVEYIKKEKNL